MRPAQKVREAEMTHPGHHDWILTIAIEPLWRKYSDCRRQPVHEESNVGYEQIQPEKVCWHDCAEAVFKNIEGEIPSL